MGSHLTDIQPKQLEPSVPTFWPEQYLVVEGSLYWEEKAAALPSAQRKECVKRVQNVVVAALWDLRARGKEGMSDNDLLKGAEMWAILIGTTGIEACTIAEKSSQEALVAPIPDLDPSSLNAPEVCL